MTLKETMMILCRDLNDPRDKLAEGSLHEGIEREVEQRTLSSCRYS